MTCTRTQEFLAKNKVSTKATLDARKNKMGAKEALELLNKIDEVYAAKGKKVIHFNLKKDKPSNEDLLAVLLGPTGNLRAPSAIVGKTLIVGFDPDTYSELVG
jgi:arsenate reductase-like glutaredoxin family protein